jgi:hypothetical protein
MKSVTTFVLAFCFILLALATLVLAEEHYIYRDLGGKLVISNQPPPAGSHVLRKLDLPEPTDPQFQQPREGNDTQLNGHSEDAPKRPEKK